MSINPEHKGNGGVDLGWLIDGKLEFAEFFMQIGTIHEVSV